MLKLGFHFMPGDRQEAHEWYALSPASVKFASIDLDWARDAENRALVNAAPSGCLVVGKMAEAPFNFEVGDVNQLAREYLQHFLPMLDILPRVDIWEGLNEVGITPEQPDFMKRYADFCIEFARLMLLNGRKAGIGAWATGTPRSLDQWQYWIKALQTCENYGAQFTRHNYGPLDEYLGLRHRADRKKWNDLNLGFIPMLITEFGADLCGVPGWGAWKSMGWTIEQYYDQLIKPFILAINQDQYVTGAHIFTLNGSGGWNEYDIAHSGLLQLLQRDIAQLESKQVEHPTYVTIFTSPDEVSNVGAAFLGLGTWLTERGDPVGFSYPVPFWYKYKLPFLCRLNPLNAQMVHEFSKPGQVATGFRKVTYTNINVDQIAITPADGVVYLRTFVFSDGRELWLRAVDCAAQ
jgi:hypothetical protein